MANRKRPQPSIPREADGPYTVYPRPGASEARRATESEIAERAYQFWLEGGCRQGADQEDWLRAEQLLNRGWQAEVNGSPPPTEPRPEAGD